VTETEADTENGGCDHGYAVTDCLWGTEPEPLIAALAGYRALAGAVVLDAGCGEGRNTAYLAGAGAKVTALDVSALALEHARRCWPQLDGVEWEQADILTRPLPEAGYDIVVCDSVLHWLRDRQRAIAAVRLLQQATRPGGVHVVCSFNDRRLDYRSHATPPRCLLADAELLGFYAGWNILEHHDEDTVSSHADVPARHYHSVTKFIARRPFAGALG